VIVSKESLWLRVQVTLTHGILGINLLKIFVVVLLIAFQYQLILLRERYAGFAFTFSLIRNSFQSVVILDKHFVDLQETETPGYGL
jgi:hypothetical protein